MATAREIAEAADRRDIRNRWFLSAPALVIIALLQLARCSSCCSIHSWKKAITAM
jgi:hypothetical protein